LPKGRGEGLHGGGFDAGGAPGEGLFPARLRRDVAARRTGADPSYGEPFNEMRGALTAVDYAETNHLGKEKSEQGTAGFSVYIKTAFGHVMGRGEERSLAPAPPAAEPVEPYHKRLTLRYGGGMVEAEGFVQAGFGSARGPGNPAAGGSGGGEGPGSKTNETNHPKNKLPDNHSILRHIFREADGHIQDTPENRALLEETANNPANFRGVDKYGNEWYTRTRSDGRQVWVEARNRTIFEGGINATPKLWNSETGLKTP
jgi:hypothetical protein